MTMEKAEREMEERSDKRRLASKKSNDMMASMMAMVAGNRTPVAAQAPDSKRHKGNVLPKLGLHSTACSSDSTVPSSGLM